MEPDAAPDAAVLAPGPLRDRVVALVSARLGAVPSDVVPAAVRPFVRFTPSKRARLAAAPLSAALAADPVFRQAVATAVAEGTPALVRAVEERTAPREDAAALAWLTRPEGWEEEVAAVAEELAARRDASQQAAGVDAVQRLTEQLEAARAASRAEADRLRAELAEAREQAVALRRDVRSRGDRAARAEAAARAAQESLEAERSRLAPLLEQAQAEVRAAQARAEQAEGAVAAARQAAREGRSADELRLRVLLDALLGAASGLRRELALAPLEGRPADAAAGDYTGTTPATAAVQGRDRDDPALLDALLAVPLTHLLVDGYNVTKTGYGDLALEAQRGRLLSGLGALVARTGVEVTVVFDGAERVTPVALAAPRGVRLLFSRAGETADDVLVRLVGLEPPGRPLLVVSDDREVGERSARVGGRAVPARALLRLLSRG